MVDSYIALRKNSLDSRYKPAGLTTGPYGGKKDGFESFMV